MDEVVKCYVIHQGSKLFLRTRNDVDITIVQHCEYGITEIIAYEPYIDVEAKRIYLNSGILLGILNGGEADSKLSFSKSSDVLSTASFDSVTIQAITEFVRSRLIISKFEREESCFEVALSLNGFDGVSWSNVVEVEELVCAKVDDLQPYPTKQHKKEHCRQLTIDTSMALNDVQDSSAELLASVTDAKKAVTFAKPIEASSPLSLQRNMPKTVAAGADASVGAAGAGGCRVQAQCAAKDNQPTPKVSRQQLLKRANSSRSVLNTSNNTSKRSLRVATRSESRDIADFAVDPSADPWASPEADYSTLGNDMSDGSAHVGFVRQMLTRLPILVASFSSMFKAPSANHRESVDSNSHVHTRPKIEHYLADGAAPTTAASRLISLTSDLAVDDGEVLIDDESPPVMGIQKQRSKGKRSSYFGAVLEKLIRADSEPESQVFTAEAPSQKLPAPSCSLSIKPCRRARWLPWNLFGTATVVPME